jgi:hypothetical protein
VVKPVEAHHRVAIAGRVTDAGTLKPLGGVAVKIVGMPAALERISAMKRRAMQHGSGEAQLERVYRTRTAADGLFYFLDLPDGHYTIAATLSPCGRRYGSSQGGAKVSRDAKGNLTMAFLELGLQPTTVLGKVTGGKSALLMAEIRVMGSDERVFSDAQGRYALRGIEPGKRVIVAVARGYKAASKPITIEQPGEVATVNFALILDTDERTSGVT